MSNQISYKADLNEIIFDKKNKEYGAYQLRKKYKFYLTLALWIAIILTVVGTTAPIIISKLKPKEEINLNRKKVVTVTQLAQPESIDKKQEVQQQVEAPPPLKSTIQFLPPVVKPDDMVADDYVPTVEELHTVDPGAKTQEGSAAGIDYSLIEVQETKQEIVEEVETRKEEPFTYVEEMPSFPGGEESLLSFIQSNVQYPEIAKRAGVEGKVYVSFVVEKNGAIAEAKVAKGIGAGCDEEALRVVRMMERWKPGKQNGKAVRVRVLIPFTFKLN